MSELKEVLDQYGQAFEEYKKTNDARYEELKKGTGKAGELEEKLSKIEATLAEKEKQLSDIEAKMNRPGFAGMSEEDQAKADHKKAFDAFVRKGITDGLADLQVKA
ncbi:MAG: phage major capsid protein, partial [Synergistaceae bacterium]|nr:phage major capsid protein [Synergistaceae bacterium]